MNTEFGYEIDFLPVGEGEKSGDAIAIRYGNLWGPREEQTIITVDGGTLDSGDALVKHIIEHYQTDRVDISLLTHPDNDHASGMRRVIEKLDVGQVVMHLPWNHSPVVKEWLCDGRVTVNGLSDRAKENLCSAWEIAQLAEEKGIPIIEPFAGCGNQNGFIVLGPTPEYYQSLLANFDFMPGKEVKPVTLSGILKEAGKKLLDMVPESWFGETLLDPADDATSAKNNSSVIFLLNIGGRKLLFTGDAGVPALTNAADFADAVGISLEGINFAQVPHHGSRRNIGKTILNRLFGNIRQSETLDWTAFISAAKDGAPKHPHKKVTNAFRRRGAFVHVTAGSGKRHHHNAPERLGWVAAEMLPFFSSVENDD